MMKTKSIYSIETVKVTDKFADVLILEDNLDGSDSVFPLHIVIHSCGELDFFKGNNESFEVTADLGFSDEVWEVVMDWVVDNVPSSDDEE